jgi:hypothetical protein
VREAIGAGLNEKLRNRNQDSATNDDQHGAAALIPVDDLGAG